MFTNCKSVSETGIVHGHLMHSVKGRHRNGTKIKSQIIVLEQRDEHLAPTQEEKR
jgi:hypothetical protein